MTLEESGKITIQPKIESTWLKALADEFHQSYFLKLKEQLIVEKQKYVVLPPGNKIFSAFNTTPLDKVKVVIIGQDPYHGIGQANGLCFSVSEGIAHPPSLSNIFKELESDLNLPYPESGNLEHWANQGVLLLNSALTVRKGEANSHADIGWNLFTDAVIRILSEKKENLIFLLWGGFAKRKGKIIDRSRHI
ncbi:MAG: uracil-DNA glycosylase, partial [Crocinitomicaceae bacterium]|nr:uracil-DNA glycosylase [Crocinitomicaceae bacterium]